MTQHKSAEKRVRQNVSRRALNRSTLAQLKTQVKKLGAAVASGDAEQARQLLPVTVGELDRAKKKGVVHANAAARTKSRLTRRVNAIQAEQA